MKDRFLGLLQRRIVIFDGAMGTMLQSLGLKPGEPGELWNLTKPEKVKLVHKGYFDAGCDVVITNTFGANRLKLARFGLAEKVREINIAGVRLAKELAGDQQFVAGGLGPTGELIEPLGPRSYPEVYEAFSEQVLALVEGEADLIIIETMSDLEELKAASRAAKEHTNLPVITQMTFNPGKSGYRTVMGIEVKTMIKAMREIGVEVVGSNCGTGIENMIPLMREFRSLTDLYLIAQPNAGLPELIEGRVVYRQTPEEMANLIPELIATGVNIIGGCCGTTPYHLSLIVKKIKGGV